MTKKPKSEIRTSRRLFLAGAAAAPAVLTQSCQPTSQQAEKAAPAKLLLADFQPRSMLQVPVTNLTRAKFPAIDMHTHLAQVFSRPGAEDSPLRGTPPEQFAKIIEWMDEMNIQTLVNFTSRAGKQLERNMKEMVAPHPGRFVTCVQPTFRFMGAPDYPERQAKEIRKAKEQGAIGVKILKSLGLGIRENGDSGPLIKVDDKRLDPMWEEAGGLGMPVFIHTSDPDAFFLPVNRFNERWDELGNHPNWSFYDHDYPPKEEILAARNRVIERHPKTTFVGLHVANHAEKLDDVCAWLDKYPNMYCGIGARIGALGRQPRRARKFFEDYADRIMFGTDASPNGTNEPQQTLVPEMYHCYFRFLETMDDYFDYSPAAIPPQGRWKIYGIGLPDAILKKVYHNNAARLLGMKLL